MSPSTVTWRQAVAVVVATLTALVAIMVVVRSDGLPAVDAASARATAWFVHQPTGRVVLVDGYGGRALASRETGTRGEQISVAEASSGAYVLNDTTAEARAIDAAELTLGTPFGLATLGDGRAIARVSQAGLVVVDPVDDEATVVAVDAEPVAFPADVGAATVIAPDGAIWSIVDGDLRRITSTAESTIGLDAPTASLTMVGNTPLVVDVEGRRALAGDGDWHALPTEADPSEIVAQVPGPSAECGWVAADDDLWCVSADGIEHAATIAGLDVDGSDFLAVAGDAAAVVRRGPSSIVRFDWRGEEILDDLAVSVPSDAALAVSTSTDLVWIDDSAGDFVWAVNPWSIEAIDKNGQGILVLGEDGEIVDAGDSGADAAGADDSAVLEPEQREPDDNGIDDPPVAIDDSVTARSGSPVPVQVTANDYDPDGEAIIVSEVGRPGHGGVEIGNASTVVYTPEPGYVGLDEFDYTIVDGNGTAATATVIVELLAVDATNKPPVGVPDVVETGSGVPVVIDVLLNDVDPERDSLRIGGFSPPDATGQQLGQLTETVGPSDLPALAFSPVAGFEGTVVFTYRPVDALDAVGDDVEVRVEVARVDGDNRPPSVRPDAVRLRRNVETKVPVLVNDSDPDGDALALSVVEPLPAGLEVDAEGEQLSIVARAGAAPLIPFQYEVDDGRGEVVRGSVLVAVIDDVEPNRPPLVTADTAKVVVGESVVIDVIANDSDPDGDPLTVVDVSQPDQGRGQVVVFSRDRIQFTPGPLTDDTDQVNARFTYTVSDGNGHEVIGDVNVTVLPEALLDPPFARDDSTFTFVDVPVTVDVLRNDGDPSGGRPTLIGRPGCPAGGTAVVTVDGQIRFDPPAGRSGAFRCSYEVTNARGLRASASIIVSVREPELRNEPPDAVIDRITVELGGVVSRDVTDNDRDPDGDDTALEVVSSTAPTLGTAQRTGNVITFTAGSQTGATTIRYQVADADGAVSLGFLLVQVVEPANVAPIAVDDVQAIFGPGTPQLFSVLSNDSDPDETPGGLTVASVTLVSGEGSASLSGDSVTISPEPSYVGDLVASYTISDGEGLTATADVVLTVNEPLNRPPDARDDAADLVNGGTVTVPVLLNDVDPDGDELSVEITDGPATSLGSAVLEPNRAVTFTADPGSSGTATIGYRVSDGEFSDDAVLRITVRACTESTPVAGDGFLQTGYQQPVAVDIGSFAANGSIVDVVAPPGYANGIYTPPAGENGNVSINYAVVNSCRLRATGQITIDVNQDPTATPKTIEMSRGEVREIPVSDLASDAEALTISGSTGAPPWVTTEASRLVIAPPLAAGATTFDWGTTVRDPGGLTASVALTVRVRNAVPVATGDTIDVSAGAPATFEITANDIDPDGSATELMIRSVPASITFSNGEVGTVSIVGGGSSVRVDPADGAGAASFAYTVEDPDGGVSAAATVTVTGPRVNTAPVADDQVVDVTVGVSNDVPLDAGDVDGDAVTVVELDDPSGVVTARAGLIVTLRADAPGMYEFTYRVDDGVAASRVATVTVRAKTSDPTTTTPSTTTTTTTTATSTTTTTSTTTSTNPSATAPGVTRTTVP